MAQLALQNLVGDSPANSHLLRHTWPWSLQDVPGTAWKLLQQGLLPGPRMLSFPCLGAASPAASLAGAQEA